MRFVLFLVMLFLLSIILNSRSQILEGFYSEPYVRISRQPKSKFTELSNEKPRLFKKQVKTPVQSCQSKKAMDQVYWNSLKDELMMQNKRHLYRMARNLYNLPAKEVDNKTKEEIANLILKKNYGLESEPIKKIDNVVFIDSYGSDKLYSDPYDLESEIETQRGNESKAFFNVSNALILGEMNELQQTLSQIEQQTGEIEIN